MVTLDPRWVALKEKLAKIAENLDVALKDHKAAASDPKTRDAADAALRDAVNTAVTSVNQIVDTPPGTFPAING